MTYERQRTSTSDVSHSVATDKRAKESKTTSKKRLPIFRRICKSQKNTFKQQGLQAFGFNHKVNINKKLKQTQLKNSIQTPFNIQNTLNVNRYKGDILTKLGLNHTRLFYININGIDNGNGDHFLLQLCQHLQEVGVVIISLTETNVHWKRPHATSNFKKILQDTWPEDSIGTCTSESNISWSSDYKPGGTVMISLTKITSATINKGEDPQS